MTVTGTTDAADCGLLRNTATVAAGNEPAAATADNSATATIAVNADRHRSERPATDAPPGRTPGAARSVAVRKPATPAPNGRFAVAELIRARQPGAFLGQVVFALTGYSGSSTSSPAATAGWPCTAPACPS